VGAFSQFGGDLVIVDFGTATTFDVVDSDGAYIGGAIAPGVNLSLSALHRAAAALPNVDVTRPGNVIGTNTVACMQSGVFFGYVGLIRGICREIEAEHGCKMRVIATGGLATLFDQEKGLFDRVDTDLTMTGLVEINRFNRKAA
ncbi:MAG: type III pantothenate kinase, partial [Paracoccaceae bacterium]